MVAITVGPVVGKVTQHTARIVVEVDTDCKAAAVISEATNQDAQFTVPNLKLKANRALGFTITHLKAGTEYIVYMVTDEEDEDEGRKQEEISNSQERKAQFFTYGKKIVQEDDLDEVTAAAGAASSSSSQQSTDRGNWVFRSAVVSQSGDSSKPDLWNVMADRVLSNKMKRLDLIVHVGGQIDGDKCFQSAKQLLSSEDADIPDDQAEKIAELYRQAYRQSFNQPHMKRILSSVPNLMLLGESDIRKDWGSRPSEKNTSSQDCKIGSIARRVYWEYGRALWDETPVEQLSQNKPEFSYHQVDNLGLLIVDVVASRTICNDGSNLPVIGQEQLDFIKSTLNTAASINGLLVASSSPLALATASSAEFNAPTSVQDSLAFAAYKEDQQQILSALQKWKNASRGTLAVSGGLGFGCHSQLTCNNDKFLDQLLCGPVSAVEPSTWISEDKVKNKQYNLGEFNITNNEFCVNNRSFGIVDVHLKGNQAAPNFHSFIIKPSQNGNQQGNDWDIAEGFAVEREGKSCCTIN